ncbi:hypothetical protein JCM33774_49140 [Actinophytocola sp. KF-1]
MIFRVRTTSTVDRDGPQRRPDPEAVVTDVRAHQREPARAADERTTGRQRDRQPRGRRAAPLAREDRRDPSDHPGDEHAGEDQDRARRQSQAAPPHGAVYGRRRAV